MIPDAVLGVSGDDVESHVKFIGDQQIPFQLLADEGNKVSSCLGLNCCHEGLAWGCLTMQVQCTPGQRMSQNIMSSTCGRQECCCAHPHCRAALTVRQKSQLPA